MPGENGQFYRFGGFRLDARRAGLWLDNKLVQLPSKALELLILLVRQKGNIVSREDCIWSFET
jgi:DNA-binding winged helix-turn-helix (wHTH) protein